MSQMTLQKLCEATEIHSKTVEATRHHYRRLRELEIYNFKWNAWCTMAG